MFVTTLKENRGHDFTVSYDSKFDILRLSNNQADSFYYENVSHNLLLMIDEDNDEVIGAQVLGVLRYSDENLKTIRELNFPNLKKALEKTWDILHSNVQ